MLETNAQNQYFLPPVYDDNRIVLLARDPFWLYAYWEISREKRNDFFDNFGNNLWDKSIPVLKVTNISRNDVFYVRINDFSNSWYINVSDSNNVYAAEIGRMVREQFFVSLASSNHITTPGDSISQNTTSCFADYRDLRVGTVKLKKDKAYETFYSGHQIKMPSVPSSPEMPGIGRYESISGISSIIWSTPPAFNAQRKG